MGGNKAVGGNSQLIKALEGRVAPKGHLSNPSSPTYTNQAINTKVFHTFQQLKELQLLERVNHTHREIISL